MSTYCTSCLAVVLTLANSLGVYAQSGQLPAGAKATQQASSEPQIVLRLKVFDVVKSRKYASEIAELSGKRINLNQDEESVESNNEIELVKSTERLTQILNDLTKTGDAKVIAETEMMLTPGIPSRFRHGEEIDFAGRNPKPNKMIDITDTIEQDATSVNPASNDSIRFAGTTILAKGTIVSAQSVQLELNAELTAMDYTTSSKIPGLRKQTAALTVALAEGRSVVLGPWQSNRKVSTKDKIPVLGSIPVVGAAFHRTSTVERVSQMFVFATTEIIQP
jgi:type II secretory pathway component GspD/PulD (secretin)